VELATATTLAHTLRATNQPPLNLPSLPSAAEVEALAAEHGLEVVPQEDW
jgi:hypothetical protein